MLSPSLFHIYAEHIMGNTGLDESQAGIKIAGNSKHNYVSYTTLKAEREEDLKSPLMKVKESEKAGLKLNIPKTKIMASGIITLWQTDEEKWKH